MSILNVRSHARRSAGLAALIAMLALLPVAVRSAGVATDRAGEGLSPDSSAATNASPAPAADPVKATPLPVPASATRAWAAIVLPLRSASFGRAAEAVRDGFLAAATNDGQQDAIVVVAYDDGGIEGAIEAARFLDADWIVGPLTREDVSWLAGVSDPLPPVLALNQPDAAAKLPANVHTFALAVEGEARQAAARMRQDGVQSAAIVVGTGAFNARVAAAFEAEWARQGGTIAGRHAPGKEAAAPRRLREEVRRSGAEALFLALDAADAQRLRPALGPLRIYSTSQVYEGQDATQLRDLDGVRFFGMPWITRPDSEPVSTYTRPESASAALERLYAFGIDAWRLVSSLRRASGGATLEIDGVTGRIVAAGPQQFARDGVLTEIRDGRLVAVDSR